MDDKYRMRKLIIILTGQERSLWETWKNLKTMVLDPARDAGLDVVLGVCADDHSRARGFLWASEEEKREFETRLVSLWKGWDDRARLYYRWAGRSDPLFVRARESLQAYRDRGALADYWYHYLVDRSGSCIEYAQFGRIYQVIVENEVLQPDDLLLRTRTDILFRYPLDLSALSSPFLMNPETTLDGVIKALLPGTRHADLEFRERDDRESCIYPKVRLWNRWIITLRKNLIFVLPAVEAAVLTKIPTTFGDWDTEGENVYWFNAESQFRGCLRHHFFTVYEYSQDHDECFGDFSEKSSLLPVYGIQR